MTILIFVGLVVVLTMLHLYLQRPQFSVRCEICGQDATEFRKDDEGRCIVLCEGCFAEDLAFEVRSKA